MYFPCRAILRASLIGLGAAFFAFSQAKTILPAAKAPSMGLPLPIAAMMAQGQGVKFQDKFEAPGGLTGYVLSAANGERRIYYVTPDRKHAVLGIMFDERLNNVTAEHQKTYMNVIEFIDAVKPDASKTQGSPLDMAMRIGHAFVEGNGADLYVVFDPSCEPCAQMYRETRPYLDRIRIHWIPVALSNEQSQAWLQVFLQARNKDLVMQAMFNKESPPAVSPSEFSKNAQSAAREILKAAGATKLPLSLFLDVNNLQQLVLGPLSNNQMKGLAKITDAAQSKVLVKRAP